MHKAISTRLHTVFLYTITVPTAVLVHPRHETWLSWSSDFQFSMTEYKLIVFRQVRP